jgi:ferrous-iron efflux pump FieF
MKSNFLIKRAVSASILTSSIIIIAKIIGWYVTDSLTILASLTDSLLDIAVSFINFIAAKYALQPPDDEHRFGHGKAEDLAVFAQSAFFSLSGIFIMVVSIKRLIYPTFIEKSGVGIVIMLFSVFITIALVSYQSYVVRRTRSNIVKADRVHYSMDLFSNIAVIASLYLSTLFNSKIIDPIFALFIAIYIIYNAGKLISSAFNNLMDREFKISEKKKLHKIIMSYSEVKGYHDLKTRHSGRESFIQFHIELDGKMSLYASHEVAEKIEQQIMQIFQEAEIIIHQDPVGIQEKKQFYKL